MDMGRVEYYLDLWKEYMEANDSYRLGYKTKSSGFNTGGINSFEDMSEELDYNAAKTVDAVIDDLPESYKRAIYIMYLNTPKITTSELNSADALSEAGKVLLSIRLPKKNLY